jgi:hypothetical protein
VWALTDRLATLPESFEMARATGLTVQQVLYNAQVGVGAWGRLGSPQGVVLQGNLAGLHQRDCVRSRRGINTLTLLSPLAAAR